MNLNQQNLSNGNNNILSLITVPIFMNNIHEHPLIYCCPLGRKNYGVSWNCNNCNLQFKYEISSFYCTNCDFDLCPNCLGEFQIDQITLYNPYSNVSNDFKNIIDNEKKFQWQIKIQKHNHFLTLIQKENKNSFWTCDNCSNVYQNKEASYYCSLCDYDICKKCFNNISGQHPINDSLTLFSNSSFKETNLKNHKSNSSIKANPLINNKIKDFQIKSFQILSEDYQNKNLIYSPLSIQILLGLLANGISDKSLTELKETFLFSDLQTENNMYSRLFQTLSNISSLKMANVIFSPFDSLTTFKPYINIYKIKFSSNKEEINNFITQTINNKIYNYFDKPILFGMTMANILFFKEEWKKKFEENIFKKKFFANNNKEKSVKMINLRDKFNYYKDRNVEAIEIPYKIEGLFALILLPNKEISLDNLIKNLNSSELDKIINGLTLKEIDLTMPKFNLEENNKINLQNILIKLGIKSIFESNEDFTKIFGNLKKTIINEILQTNLIGVDEKGNDNILFLNITSPLVKEKNLVINRPFLFIVRNINLEKGKEIILFAKIYDL